MVKNWPSHLISSTRARVGGAFLAIGFIVALLSFVAPQTAGAQSASPITHSFSQTAGSLSDTSGLTSGYAKNVSSCQIEQVGWVICPVMRSIAKLADYGFAFININFLKIEYGISNTDSGVYKAWEIMRNVANALFVIAFMAIVYAQITGRGGGGYNIKRMLPRLIIGAILVNISYFVCVIGIELSNAIGGSILAIMQQVSDSIGPSAMSLTSAQNGFEDSRLFYITDAVLQKSGTVWILLAPVAAVTVSIAVICAAGLVLLIMRKVIVAMLVLVSPLMFVTYLLPNTEHYFQQWLRLFFQLLLLYPVIAFLLGTGQIISATIINVGSESDSNYRVRDDGYQARNGGSGSITTDLAAAGAAVLPLLGTWFLLKSLSSVVTNAGTKVAGNIGRRGKNEEEKIKAKMDSKAKQSIAGAGLPTYDRRPAFSRLRRRRGSAIASGLPSADKAGAGNKAGAGKAAGAGTGADASLFDRAIGNVNGAGEKAGGDEQSRKLEEAANARIAEADAQQLQANLTGGDDKKGKSAKDIFNNLNKTHSMDDKKSGGGGGGSGPSQDTAGAGATPAPKAPSNNYAAGMTAGAAQSAPSPQQSQKVIAVPVEVVDASTFLKKDGGGAATAGAANAAANLPPPPASEIEEKAKARANKYIFDSQRDLDDASKKLDELKDIQLRQKKADQDAKDHLKDAQ